MNPSNSVRQGGPSAKIFAHPFKQRQNNSWMKFKDTWGYDHLDKVGYLRSLVESV